jgi:ABC-type Na+ efflux pump permease subunit
MRDFFINGFEILLGVIIVCAIIGVIVMAGLVAFGNGTVIQGMPMQASPLVGLAFLVGGLLYVVFIGGLMYLGLGIYQNTKKTAAALERMAGK